MVDYEILYNRPYDFIISDEFKEENDIDTGDTISLEFSDEDESWSIAATAKGEENFDMEFSEESQSLFHLISGVSFDQMPEKLQNELENGDLHDRSNQPKETHEIGQSEELRRYLHDIMHYLRKRALDADILVGSGYLCHTPTPRYKLRSLLKSPYTMLGKDILRKETRPKLNNIEKISVDTHNPNSVYFCTNRVQISDERKNEIRQSLRNRIIDTQGYYLFEYEGFPVHGPLAKETDNRYIYCSEDCDIEFLSIEYHVVRFNGLTTDIRTQMEELKDKLGKKLNGNNIEMDDARNSILVEYNEYDISITVQEKAVDIDIRHVTDNKLEEAQKEMDLVTDYFDNNFKADLVLLSPSELLPEPAYKKAWVFDTNSLYRQRSSQGNDKITEFITENKTLNGKSVRIPWQVLVEINRHKDAQKRTKTASERGIKNIEVLKIFSEHDFFNLEVEEMPENIDLSVFPKAGATDISILNNINEDELVITGDEYLQSMAKIQDIDAIGPSHLAKRKPLEEEETRLWSEAESILKNNPTIEQFKTELSDAEFTDLNHQTIDGVQGMENYDIDVGKADSLLSDWKSDRNVLQFVINDGICLSRSKPVDVIPTYGLLDELVDNLDEQNDERYITEEMLEEARKAVSGLQQHVYPYLKFLIPEEYAYQAEEVNQVGMLYRLASTRNTTYKPVFTNGSDRPQSLNQVALETAKEHDCILLCSTGNEDLLRLGGLLNVRVEPLSVD